MKVMFLKDKKRIHLIRKFKTCLIFRFGKSDRLLNRINSKCKYNQNTLGIVKSSRSPLKFLNNDRTNTEEDLFTLRVSKTTLRHYKQINALHENSSSNLK